jgi:hypothetical protein
MKDLAIVRYPLRGSAKAIKSALNLCFHSRARAARVLALSIVIWLVPSVGRASEALEQSLDWNRAFAAECAIRSRRSETMLLITPQTTFDPKTPARAVSL